MKEHVNIVSTPSITVSLVFSTLHKLTHPCSKGKPLSLSCSGPEGREVYLCDAVEHSDLRFSRIEDSPGRERLGEARRRKVSARNDRMLMEGVLPCQKDGNNHSPK